MGYSSVLNRAPVADSSDSQGKGLYLNIAINPLRLDENNQDHQIGIIGETIKAICEKQRYRVAISIMVYNDKDKLSQGFDNLGREVRIRLPHGATDLMGEPDEEPLDNVPTQEELTAQYTEMMLAIMSALEDKGIDLSYHANPFDQQFFMKDGTPLPFSFSGPADTEHPILNAKISESDFAKHHIVHDPLFVFENYMKNYAIGQSVVRQNIINYTKSADFPEQQMVDVAEIEKLKADFAAHKITWSQYSATDLDEMIAKNPQEMRKIFAKIQSLQQETQAFEKYCLSVNPSYLVLFQKCMNLYTLGCLYSHHETAELFDRLIHTILSEAFAHRDANIHQAPYGVVLDHFISMFGDIYAGKEVDCAAACANLEKELADKQPLSKTLQSIIGAIIGAIVGAIIGATIGGMVSIWMGGVGAIPGFITGAIVGGTAGAAALTGGALGFFRAKNVIPAYEESIATMTPAIQAINHYQNFRSA